MARAINVAKFIFNEYRQISGEKIDEMKLHKLLYLSQREALAITNEPMFPENFEGWKFGPVCREVREYYKKHKMVNESHHDLSDEEMHIVKNVISQYGALESWKLSELSHKELSWRRSRRGIPKGHNGSNIIALNDIRKDAEKIRPYDSVWDMYYDEFDDVEDL